MRTTSLGPPSPAGRFLSSAIVGMTDRPNSAGSAQLPLFMLLSASVVVPLLLVVLPHWSASCNVNAVLVTESTVGDEVFGVTATWVAAPP